MIEQRLIAAGGLPIAAKLIAGLAMTCLCLIALLWLCIYINLQQFRGAQTLKTQLTAAQVQGAAELQECANTNGRVNQTVAVLGDELHACRGAEQRVNDALQLAYSQRQRAQRNADKQLKLKNEAIQAIARTHETCGRGICRALSDELLSIPTKAKPE